MRSLPLLACAAVTLLLSACASSSSMVGQWRAEPIPPEVHAPDRANHAVLTISDANTFVLSVEDVDGTALGGLNGTWEQVNEDELRLMLADSEREESVQRLPDGTLIGVEGRFAMKFHPVADD